MRSKILDSLAWHQRGWYEQRDQRNRMILKSRQIGATWYFAREALLGALRTDVKHDYQRNQIFLSASRKQALQSRNFIRKAAEEVDVELKGGEQITLSNGAELHFLGTSAATAQSYTGHLRFDEFFWTGNFINLCKVAGAMATLKGLTRTYFSTPSSESHDGYDDWPDWKPFASRPMGQREVWLGYDANGGSGNGDAGALSVAVPPLVAGGRFRTVELKQLRGLEFEQQAAVIKEAAERYNVTHIAIDGQGVGEAVWQIVKNWFPAAICYQMSLSSKRALVL